MLLRGVNSLARELRFLLACRISEREPPAARTGQAARERVALRSFLDGVLPTR